MKKIIIISAAVILVAVLIIANLLKEEKGLEVTTEKVEKGTVIKKVTGSGQIKPAVEVRISDNGPGIPKEDLPHIFERFYRAEKSRLRSKDGKGFGLGLSIAYWIVRNHGGRIEVDSQENYGTTFCVWLPLAEGNNCQQMARALAQDESALERTG